MALGNAGGGGASSGAIRAGRAFVELFTDDTRLQRGLSRAAARMKAFGAQMQAAGASLLQFGGLAALPMALAVKTFADFDDQMRAVKAVTQSTTEEFQRLTHVAKELGRTTSFTAAQAAGIMGELGRAGFTANQIEDMTGAVLDLARATGTDAVASSGYMAATIRQFGLEAEDAVRVADALTVAANKSFNTVESLGYSLKYAGPVAADFGMSLEDTLAVLGALGNAGIQGTSAGTAVRRLLTLTAVEAERFKDLFGVEMADAAGNMKPLVDVMEEIQRASEDMTEIQRGAAFGEAFGLLGVTAGSVIGKSAASARELRDALDEAAGTARRTAKEMDAGIGGAFRIFLSAVEGTALALAEKLVPMIQRLTEWLTVVSGRLTAWIDQNPELIEQIGLITLGVIGAGAALFAAGTAAAALGAVLSGLAAIVGTVGALLGAVFSPVGLVIAAATAALVIFFTTFESGKKLAGDLAGLWEYAADIFSKAWGGIVNAIKKGDLEGALGIATAALEVLWYKAMLELRKAWDGLGAFLLSVWDDNMRAMKDGLLGLIEFAQRNAVKLAKAMFGVAPALLDRVLAQQREVSEEIAAERARLAAEGGDEGWFTTENLVKNLRGAEERLAGLLDAQNAPLPAPPLDTLGHEAEAMWEAMPERAGRAMQQVAAQMAALPAMIRGSQVGSMSASDILGAFAKGGVSPELAKMDDQIDLLGDIKDELKGVRRGLTFG
jgi:TP901 family phage tail tape measure protein